MTGHCRLRLLGAVLLVGFAGCGEKDPSETGKASGLPNPVLDKPARVSALPYIPNAEEIAENNRGVALMINFKYEDARKLFEKLSTKHPDWADAGVNLAIATLNADMNGKRALPILDRALDTEPDNLHALYTKAYLLYFSGNSRESLPLFRKVAEADPEDPDTAFKLGLCLQNVPGKQNEALGWFEKSIAVDPYFRAAYNGAQLLMRRVDRVAEAKQMLDTFRELKDNPLARQSKEVYGKMGRYANAIIIGDKETKKPAPPIGSLFAEAPAHLKLGAPKVAWNPNGGNRAACVTVADLTGDGRTDLFLAGVVGKDAEQTNAVLIRDASDAFSLAADHPLASVTAVRAALWGDFDNDGLTDAYLCREGENQLWRQTKPNVWEDVTEATKTAGGAFDTVAGALFDADHDGDLDVFLVNADGPNELLNNDRNGAFRPLAEKYGLMGVGAGSRAVLVTDLDRDRDSDLIVLNRQAPHEVYANLLTWTYEPAVGFDAFKQSPINAVVAGDLEIDGRPELVSIGPDGLKLWRPDAENGWQATVLSPDVTSMPNEPVQLALADFTGAGPLQLIATTGSSWTIFEFASDLKSVKPIHGPESAKAPLAGWTLFVGDCGNGPAVLGMPNEGAPVIWAPGPGRYPFATVSFVGSEDKGRSERSNASAIGSSAWFRIGSRWVAVSNLGHDSGPGQSLQPIAVGLGGAEKADFVRIEWPDGVVQADFDVAADQCRDIVEYNGEPTSCPVLFVWNGERHEFVSDLLAVGGLGYLIGPGEYAPSDPTENFLLPADLMQPKEGRYVLKLTEPMEELTYLDRVALTAYDLPAGWNMTLDEWLSVNGPAPTGEPRFFRREIDLLRATNERGQDVTAMVTATDGVAAPVGPWDERFLGRLADEHVLTIEFAEPIEEGPGRPLLLADGWVEFPYSQTAFAAWQAGATYEAPTLEAKGADGKWRTILPNFGYPGGMPRQISVPLEGLPEGTTSLRLRTNLEVYWDRLSIAYTEPCSDVMVHTLPLHAARVAESGFMVREIGEQRRPNFDYDRRSSISMARDPQGYYTAFGVANELVADRDNALAIFGPGEEIHLEFEQAEPVASGRTRRFVLESVGWCKDMDLYTGSGATVEPLPSSDVPVDRGKELHARYNTRYQSGG